MPYRSHDRDETTPREETGLVADMVRQFADPYAFVRELVQNGIDAGANALEARAEMRHDGSVALSVSDDGEGMTRAIIEGPLLTLFNSAKDGQENKIGKYGIGFVSVFAVEPRQVIVETWRAEGSWQLTLHPDHSYELAVGAAHEGAGTKVTLLLPTTQGKDASHGTRMHDALVRWCRHAKIPIHWTHQTHGEPVRRSRIDRPLDLNCVVSITAHQDGAHIIVGPSAGTMAQADGDPEQAATFVGFYNHGLTLFETTTPPREGLLGLRVKILSNALQHTLSRDNVRRDRAYDKAVAHAVEMSRGPLRDKLQSELADAATTMANGGDSSRYEQLLYAATSRPTKLDSNKIMVPLTDAIDGQVTRSAHKCRWPDNVFARANESTLATQTLAQRGSPVVLAPATMNHTSLALLFGGQLNNVDVMVTVVSLAPPTKTTEALCVSTCDALKAAGVTIDVVTLGNADCAALRAAVPCVGGEALLFDRHEWPDWLYRWRCADAIRLVAEHTAIARALVTAETEPVVAGAMLARYLIVEARGEIGADASDALLAIGLGANA